MTNAQRARWLAELSDALLDAGKLLSRLELHTWDAPVLDLFARIECARAQVRSLQLSRVNEPTRVVHPKWTNPLPWEPGEDRRA